MKLIAIFILITILQANANPGLAQKITISEKKVNVKQVFKEIKKQTGYNVFYLPEIINEKRTFTANFLNAPLSEVIQKCIEGAPLTYSIFEKSVVIKENVPTAITSHQLTQKDSTVIVTGQLIESDSNSSLPFVTVSVYEVDKPDRPIEVVVTKETGHFQIRLKKGPYRFKFNLLGYKPHLMDLVLKEGSKSDMGKIKLEIEVQSLNQVNVTSRRETFTLIPGGYKFNAGENIIASSSNMAELLKQVPGLTVDELGGSIQVLGKGASVLINGRKVNINGRDLLTYLKSLPGNQVSAINVLTNPGSEYDANGEGGILDIRLKKNSISGIFGSVNSNVSNLWGTDNSFNLNLKKEKIDVSVGYNFSYSENYYTRTDLIKNYSPRDSSFLFKQNRISDRFQRTHSVKTNVVYTIDTTSALSVNYWYAYLYGDYPETNRSDVFNENNQFQRQIRQTDSDLLNNDFHILDVVYDKSFSESANLSVGLNYSNYANENNMSFKRSVFDQTGNMLNNQESRIISVLRPYDILTFNADYKTKLHSSYELKFGVKYTTADTESEYENFLVNDGQLQIDDFLSSKVQYDESIKSAYASLSGKLKRFSYDIGLRLEAFNYALHSNSVDNAIANDYINWFPNASIRYSSDDRKSSFSLSAGRRIERPSYSMLNPFLKNLDISFFSGGNPNLTPYYANRAEIQFSYKFSDDHSMILSAYGNQSKNIFSSITRYNSKLDGPEINYYNDFSSKQIGSYVLLQNRLAEIININTYLSVQRPTFNSVFSEDSLLPGITSFSGNVNCFINILPKTTAQVLGFYSSQRNSFQTKSGSTGYITVGLQQKVLNDKMNIGFACEDIFNLQTFPVSLISDYLSLESINKLTSRYIRLSVSYNFGKTYSSKQSRTIQKDSRVE